MSKEPAHASSAPAELRERLLAAFLEDQPSAVLTQHDEALASLRLASGVQITLVTCPPDASPADLRQLFGAIVKANHASVAHVVAVGGDGQVLERALKKSAPFWQFRRRFGFHHVDLGGKPERATGTALPQLKRATDRAATTPPLSAERIADLLTHGRERHQEEVRLATALQGRFPWVTAVVAALCIGLFALGKHWADGNFSAVLFNMGANSGQHVRAGEVWRVLASTFLHANIEHLAVNMIALASFGPILEKLLGPRRYIILYGLSALGGGLASAFLRGPGMSVGASGAIWGLMAAGVGLAIMPRGLLPPLSLAQARRQAAIPLAINVMYSFTPGIDLFAHFGGGLVGLGLMLAGTITRGVTPVWTQAPDAAPHQAPPARGLSVVAAVLGLALLSSVAIALVVGRPWLLSQPPVLKRVQVADTGLSVELPEGISGSPVAETKDKMRIFTFGSLLRAPMAVEMIVNILPAPVAPEDLDEVMEMEKTATEESSIPGAQRDGIVKIEQLGGQPFVVVSHHVDSIKLRSWLTIFGDREVMLRAYSTEDRPASWMGIEQRIAASLRADAAPPRP